MRRLTVVRDPAQLQRELLGLRARGLRTGLVPTMGYLHAGHLSLMQRARAAHDVVVVSIFVNPTQFAPSEDLARYPRDEAGDLDKCASAGVDLAFLPSALAMYPPGFQTEVRVTQVSQGLDGGSRPGHFQGVASVVLKLLVLSQAHSAFFGEKDFQQLAVIRALVRDLALPIEIVGVPTVREPDGLALSSRNVYLGASERKDALVLSRALDAIASAVASGERDRAKLCKAAAEVVATVASARLDYVDVVDADTLEARPSIAAPAQALLAAFVGKTRLIDNRRVL